MIESHQSNNNIDDIIWNDIDNLHQMLICVSRVPTSCSTFFLVDGSGPWCEPFQPLGPRLKMSDPKIETMNKPIDMIGLVVPKLQFQFET